MSDKRERQIILGAIGEPETLTAEPSDEMLRIIELLERIAVALEAIAPPEYQPGACDFCGGLERHLPGCRWYNDCPEEL